MPNPHAVALNHPVLSELYPTLFTCTRAGLPVTPGFVVTSSAQATFFRYHNLAATIQLHLSHLNPSDPESLTSTVNLIQKLVLKQEFDPKLIHDLNQAYDRLNSSHFLLCQLVPPSFLFPLPHHLIRGESALADFLRTFWSENFTLAHLRAYLTHSTSPILSPSPLIIRSLPSAPISGFLHTQTSLDSKSTSKLAAVWGLSALFDHSVILPDLYEVDRATGFLISSQNLHQSHQLKIDRHGHISPHPVKPQLTFKPKLTRDELNTLTRLSHRLHHLFQKPTEANFILIDHQPFIFNCRAFDLPAPAPTTLPSHPASPPTSLQGLGCSSGLVTASLHFVLHPKQISTFKFGEIAFIPTASSQYLPLLQKAGGLICFSGGITSHLAILARELGLPMVTGIKPELLTHLSGKTLTLDGTRGLLYPKAHIPKPISLPTALQPTATKVFVTVSQIERALNACDRSVNGVGVLSGASLLSTFGYHPKYVEHQKLLPQLRAHFFTHLEGISHLFGDRPIYYLPADLQTSDLFHLKGGHLYELQEVNPFIGYRGAFRLSHDTTLFDLELSVIKALLDSAPKHFGLLFPFIRSLQEAASLKRLVLNHGLSRAASFAHLLSIDTVAVALDLEAYLKLGFDGVSVNLDHLVPLVLGADPASTELQPFLDPRHPSVHTIMSNICLVTHRYNLPIHVRGFLISRYPDILNSFVSLGISSVTVNYADVPVIKSALAHAEMHHLEHQFIGV